MKLLKDWSCDYKIDTNATLTVGQKFGILCQGETNLNPNETPSIKFIKEDQKYDLVLLRHKFKSDHELFLSVSSWKTGTHNLKGLELITSEFSIPLDGPKIKVESVLAQDSKMNLPPGAIIKNFPAYTWYVLGLLFALGLFYCFRIYRRSRRIDRGLLRLNSFKTSLSPFYEYQRQIRMTKKSLEVKVPKDELNKLTRGFYKSTSVFLSLLIDTPLFVLNEKETLRAIHKKIKKQALVNEYFYIIQELKKTALEVEKDSKSENIKTLQLDLESLVDEANEFSQKINKYIQDRTGKR